MTVVSDPFKDRLLTELRHHLAGLRAKVELDFAQVSFDHELLQLKSDNLYSAFALDCSEYVLVRLMGRLSISIGRRLGEIYDKVPRLVAAARFNLTQNQVAPKLNALELDIGLSSVDLSPEDFEHVKATVASFAGWDSDKQGVGIEIRYNFNPNDSSRLRKDVDMARYVQEAGLLPIYIIFSTISPRNEAIARLERAGWTFMIGTDAEKFLNNLFGLEVDRVLQDPEVKAEIAASMKLTMESIVNSYAFGTVVKAHYPPNG
ncbi:MAG: hypothetical protein JW395_3025 [Nitrospira sp.]|nr:hypothetical protein [Nitrospira sp.]